MPTHHHQQHDEGLEEAEQENEDGGGADKYRLDVDEVYNTATGSHGLWQLLIVLIVCFSTPSTVTFPVFAHAVPRFRCKLGSPTEEAALLSKNLNFYEAARLVGPWTAPQTDHSKTGSSENTTGYGCRRYVNSMTNNNETEPCRDGYVYQPYENQYPTSIVQSFDLVCGDDWKPPLTTSIYMLGPIVGFMMGSILGDRLGRKKAIIIAGVIEVIFGIAVSFSPNHETYTIFRFILSAACTTKVGSISVMLVEITTAKYRAFLSAVFSIFINFCSCGSHAILAMWIPNWRHLHLIVMLPACLGLILLPFMPESPRWLVAQGKEKTALHVLYKAYRVNAVCKKGPKLTEPEFLAKVGFIHSDKSDDEATSATQPVKKWRSFISTLAAPYQTREIAKRSLSCIGIFTGQLCCFFGLLFYTRVIRGSVYFVSMINATTSLPAALISTLLYNRVRSRKRPLMLIYGLSVVVLAIGGAYEVVGQPDSDLSLIICCNIALVLIGAAFNMVFIYTAELFPSSIRTQGLGNAAGLGRIGSILCSFLNQLDLQVLHGLPIVIYAAVLVLLVTLTCCMPDTTGTDLKDVVERVQEDAVDDIKRDNDRSKSNSDIVA